MAQPTADGTIWQMTFKYNMSGQVLLNTFFYKQTGGVPDYPTFVTTWDTWNLAVGHMVDALLPCISAAVTLDAIIYQPIRTTRYRPITVAHALNGSQNGQEVPQNISQVVTRAGVLANKHNVGAIHLPPCQADQIINGTLDVGQINLLRTFASKVIQQAAPGGGGVTLDPVLISRNVVLAPQLITIAFPQDTIRVMRRRTVRLGI